MYAIFAGFFVQHHGFPLHATGCLWNVGFIITIIPLWHNYNFAQLRDDSNFTGQSTQLKLLKNPSPNQLLHTVVFHKGYPAIDDAIHQYDDVIEWKHFPRYWPFVRGIHR